MDPLEQSLKALDSFKDWSNYLLVTTVAALGWTAGKDGANFKDKEIMKTCAILAFAVSIVFAILVLAMVPHVAEDLSPLPGGKYPSIYKVYWTGWCVKVRLTDLCLPQHVLFLLGIVFYAVGSSTFGSSNESSKSWFILIGAVVFLVFAVWIAGNVSRFFGW
jgi:hypothetical protein